MKALNPNKTRRIRRSYFTLMELVAATGIMLAIAGIIAFASRSFFRALASAERVSAQLQVYLNIDQLMDGCFRNMILLPLRGRMSHGPGAVPSQETLRRGRYCRP